MLSSLEALYSIQSSIELLGEGGKTLTYEFGYVLVSFSVAMIKYPEKSNLKEERLIGHTVPQVTGFYGWEVTASGTQSS